MSKFSLFLIFMFGSTAAMANVNDAFKKVVKCYEKLDKSKRESMKNVDKCIEPLFRDNADETTKKNVGLTMLQLDSIEEEVDCDNKAFLKKIYGVNSSFVCFKGKVTNKPVLGIAIFAKIPKERFWKKWRITHLKYSF